MSRAGRDGWDTDPAALGTWRVLSPPGALLHLADRIDASSPINEHELLLDIDLLHVDATSFRAFAQESGGDPSRTAARIAEVVAGRGALRNPVTGSGGVARGRVREAGARSRAGARPGDLVVPLVSLIALPLRLDDVGPIDLASPEVPVRGQAVVTGRMPVLVVPPDLEDCALAAADVYPVASYAAERARPGDHVVVLGAGLAGLLAVVAAREAVGEAGTVTVVDVSASALARARTADPGVRAVAADARDAVAVVEAVRAEGLGRADLVLSCTSTPGCEGSALLLAGPEATVLFFSTATSFAAASLGADPVGASARLELSNGVTSDHGARTLDLLRRHPVLRRAFAGRSA